MRRIVILFALLMMGASACPTEPEPKGGKFLKDPPDFPEVPPADSSGYFKVIEKAPAVNDTISEKEELNEDIIGEEGADSTEYSMGLGNKLGIVVAVAVNGLAIIAWILSLK